MYPPPQVIRHATLLPQGQRPVQPPLAEAAGAAVAEGTSGAVAMAAQATKVGSENDATYHAVQHSLLTEFSVSMCTKALESKTVSVGELRQSLIDSVVGMALDFRVSAIRLQSKDPLFNSISWSFSSSAREGCSMNSFSVSSQPKRWKEALQVGMQELARLSAFGVTESELNQAVTTLNNYFSSQSVMQDALESSTWMRRIMEAVNSGDQLMPPDAKHLIIKNLAQGLSVDEVSARATELFRPFLELAERGGGGGEKLTAQNEFATAKAFVCTPDPAAGGELQLAPYSRAEFFSVLKSAIQDPEAPQVVAVPQSLVDDEEVRALVDAAKPSIISRSSDAIGPDEGKLVRFRLSNGVRVAYRQNTARPKEFRMRVSAVGGRAMETKDSQGRAVAGAALLVNGGAGEHAAEVVTRFASMNQLSYDCSCGSETLNFDMVVHTSVEGGIQRAMSLLWLFLAHPRLDSKALERFKVRVKRAAQSLPKSVERMTTKQLVACLFGEDSQWRLGELPTEIAEGIELDDVKHLLKQQLVPSNLEIAISGDFDAAELEEALVTYVGILDGGAEPPWKGREEELFQLTFNGGSATRVSEHIVDDTERAYTIMAFPTVNRWGHLKGVAPGAISIDLRGSKGLERVPDPLSAGAGGKYCKEMHVSRCMSVANDIISNRLFEEIREKRGLVYSISYSWRPYRLLSGGYSSISFMPKLEQVASSVEQVKLVLRQILDEGFTEEEFQGAKGPLVTKVRETERQNVFWVQLMEDLGNDVSPKSLDCIRQVADHYDSLTKEQVLEVVRLAMGHALDNLSIAVGTSGPEPPSSPPL